MYSMDWLIERVKFHLNPENCIGAILVAEDAGQGIVGHTILRVENDEELGRFGLFSTFYVVPEYRNIGIASRFIEAGEEWMADNGMDTFRTFTATDNERLHRLMRRHGYEIEIEKGEMVSLCKTVDRLPNEV